MKKTRLKNSLFYGESAQRVCKIKSRPGKILRTKSTRTLLTHLQA